MLRYEHRVLEGPPPKLAIRFLSEEQDVVLELDSKGVDALAREVALQAALITEDSLCVVALGRYFIQMQQTAAKQIARWLVQGKLRLEELEQAERIVFDSAILARAGAPFTLSDDPRLKEAMRQEAAWNSDLRRFMPAGVKSEAVFGLPKLVQTPPKKEAKDGTET